jgi:hypothetical protein
MTDDDDDTLREAARALREATDAPSPQADATRARLLAAHERDRRSLFGSARASQWLAVAAAFVVLFVAPSAWALYTGRAQQWIDAIVGPSRVEVPATDAPPAPTSSAARSRRTRSSEPPVAPPPTTLEPATLEPAPLPIDPPLPEPAPVVHEEPEVRPSPPLAPSTETIEDTSERDERLAYERAHALEFDEHDHAAAIAAYDRYLARYPRGRFATEARYNRAVSLAHVGRTGEALRALRPFASGGHGGYRQDEAAELVHALEASEQP